MHLVSHEEGSRYELFQRHAAHLPHGRSQRGAPHVAPLLKGGKSIRRVVAELLEALHLPAEGPVAESLVLHHPHPHVARDGARHRADRRMVMVGFEGNFSRLDLPFGVLAVLCPSFENAHADGGAPLCPAHAAPLDRRSRVEDQLVFHAGDHLGCRRHVHKHRVGSRDAANSLGVRRVDFFFQGHLLDLADHPFDVPLEVAHLVAAPALTRFDLDHAGVVDNRAGERVEVLGHFVRGRRDKLPNIGWYR